MDIWRWLHNNMNSNEPQTPTGGEGVNNNDQGNQTTENDSNTVNNNRNNSRGNRGVDNRRNLFNANKRTWEGDKGEIGAVLGLRTEYLD